MDAIPLPAGSVLSGATGAKSGSANQSCIQDWKVRPSLQRTPMTDRIVRLRLNQQQLELMDRTIAQGVAADREALVRLALREYAAARKKEVAGETSR
jgi:hypothetical protein